MSVIESDLTRLGAAFRNPEAIDIQHSRASQFEVQPGLILLSTNLKLNSPGILASQTFPAVCMSIVLDGHAEGDDVDTRFQPNEVWITSTNDYRPTGRTIEPDLPVTTVELMVMPEWFAVNEMKIGNDPAFEMMQESTRAPECARRRPLDTRLRQIAWSIQNPPTVGAATALHLESRALDLLIALRDEFTNEKTPKQDQRLSARALERIMAVRARINSDPGRLSTITSLAADFGISSSKMKRDFFLAFGVCTGAYINERRLVLGRALIEREGLSVSEAAYQVGYAHPGNFTAAFRRRFGYLPSSVKPFS